MFSLTVSRSFLFAALVLFFGLLVFVSLRVHLVPGYVFLVGATAFLAAILFRLTDTTLSHAIIPIVIGATNFLPDETLRRRTNWLGMSLAVGATEGLIVRRHLTWLGELANLKSAFQQTIKCLGWVFAVVLLSASIAVLVKGERLVPIEQALRMPKSADILMRADINGLVIDTDKRRLYATGHGLDRIHQFDLDNLDARPRVSTVASGGAQGIFLDTIHSELIVFNGQHKELLFIDADTLKLNRKVAVPQLSSGDPWVTFDPVSETIALVSEADLDDGTAFLLLDHVSGKVIDTRDLDAGNLLKHPEKPWLYLSFFRRNPEILIYDLAAREIVGRAAAPARIDRMVLIESTNELLVTSPVNSEILRLDADTLAAKGALKGPFGVRTLAFDPDREILFAGSFVTGQIITIDLRTSRTTGTVYLGPWLRTIVVDAEKGTAYLSSNGALYGWKYD
ncbi:MAG: hypothetical protein RLO80_12735 [Hyphomonas sp.]